MTWFQLDRERSSRYSRRALKMIVSHTISFEKPKYMHNILYLLAVCYCSWSISKSFCPDDGMFIKKETGLEIFSAEWKQLDLIEMFHLSSKRRHQFNWLVGSIRLNEVVKNWVSESLRFEVVRGENSELHQRNVVGTLKDGQSSLKKRATSTLLSNNLSSLAKIFTLLRCPLFFRCRKTAESWWWSWLFGVEPWVCGVVSNV